MEEKKERLVIEENAVYELDLECIRRKEKEREDQKNKKAPKGHHRK